MSGSTVSGLAVAITVESRFMLDVTIFLPEDSNAFFRDGEFNIMLTDFAGLVVVKRVRIFVPSTGLQGKNMTIHS